MMQDRNPFGDEDLTPEEMEAFNSMREADSAPQAGEVETEAQTEPQTKQPPESAPEASGDDDPEVVTIGEDGRARNAQGKFVPHKALHAEREEHKKTRNELQTERMERVKISERLGMLLQAYGVGDVKSPQQTQPRAPEAGLSKPINFEEDPLGAMKQAQELLPRLDELNKTVEELRASRKADADKSAVREMSDRYQRDINAARANTEGLPGFEDAVRFLVKQQDALLEAQGYTDPLERRRQIEGAERNLVMGAYERGANPADTLYKLARASGWQNSAQAAPVQQNGKVAEKIANINKMQKASPSLSVIPGSNGETLASVDQIASMDEDEFAAFVNKVGGQKAFSKRYLGA